MVTTTLPWPGIWCGVGVAGSREGKDGFDPGPEPVGVDEGGDLHELALIGLDDEEGALDALVGGVLVCGRDGDGEAAGLEQRERAQSMSAPTVSKMMSKGSVRTSSKRVE